MKTRKTFFILSSICTLFSAIFLLITLVIMFSGSTFTPYAIKDFLTELNYTDIDIEIIIETIKYAKVIFCFLLVFNLIILFVSFNYAFKTPETINKNLLLTILVMSWLFNNIVASIFLSLAYYYNSKLEFIRESKSGITKEIESIRKLYKQGAISKEEYDRLVNELFNKIEFNQQ